MKPNLKLTFRVIVPQAVSENSSDERSDEEESETLEPSGLREDRDEEYSRFLSIFVGCFLPGVDTIRIKGTSHLLSKYMSSSLEAFAVVLYANNYDKFKRDIWDKANGSEDISSVSGGVSSRSSSVTKFTSSIKNTTGKYGGWSKQGLRLYNTLFQMICKQREDKEKTKVFEERVRTKIKRRISKTKRKRKDTIKVHNNLSELGELLKARK